jgi:hypothetical protein
MIWQQSATVTHVLMIDYLGLINSSRGLLTDSVICFLLVFEYLMRHPHVISDVTSKFYTLELNKTLIFSTV